MSNMKELFETVVSMVTTVGAKSAMHGGKSAALAAARKVGWADKSGSGRGRFSNPSIGRKRLACGFGHGRNDLANYDPKKIHKESLRAGYKAAMLSGSGLGQEPIRGGSNRAGSRLRRTHDICRFEAKGSSRKPGGKRFQSQLKTGVSMLNTKF